MSPGLRTLVPSLSTAKTSLGLALSHSTVLSLGAASATGVVEVLLELRVNERLQYKTSEREKPREKIVKPDDRRRWTGRRCREGQMFVGQSSSEQRGPLTFSTVS